MCVPIRTIQQFAVKCEVALNHRASMTQFAGDLHVESNAQIDAMDGESSGGCVQTSANIIGIMMGSGALSIAGGGSPLDGNPHSRVLGTSAAALDSIGLNWDVLTSSAFAVDYENTWPSCALPADSFTVTGFTGNLTTPAPLR